MLANKGCECKLCVSIRNKPSNWARLLSLHCFINAARAAMRRVCIVCMLLALAATKRQSCGVVNPVVQVRIADSNSCMAREATCCRIHDALLPLAAAQHLGSPSAFCAGLGKQGTIPAIARAKRKNRDCIDWHLFSGECILKWKPQGWLRCQNCRPLHQAPGINPTKNEPKRAFFLYFRTISAPAAGQGI